MRDPLHDLQVPARELAEQPKSVPELGHLIDDREVRRSGQAGECREDHRRKLDVSCGHLDRDRLARRRHDRHRIRKRLAGDSELRPLRCHDVRHPCTVQLELRDTQQRHGIGDLRGLGHALGVLVGDDLGALKVVDDLDLHAQAPRLTREVGGGRLHAVKLVGDADVDRKRLIGLGTIEEVTVALDGNSGLDHVTVLHWGEAVGERLDRAHPSGRVCEIERPGALDLKPVYDDGGLRRAGGISDHVDGLIVDDRVGSAGSWCRRRHGRREQACGRECGHYRCAPGDPERCAGTRHVTHPSPSRYDEASRC